MTTPEQDRIERRRVFWERVRNYWPFYTVFTVTFLWSTLVVIHVIRGAFR